MRANIKSMVNSRSSITRLNTVAAIAEINITNNNHFSDAWFRSDILGCLNGADIDFIDKSANGDEFGIVVVHQTMPTESVVLD